MHWLPVPVRDSAPTLARRLRSSAIVCALVAGLVALTLGVRPTSAGAATLPRTVGAPATVEAAVAAADADANVGVAVLDTTTGDLYTAGEATTDFPTESVVKVLIAANLLATGKMTGQTEQMAYQMITQSDDDDADDLWGVVNGPGLISWAEQRYQISDLGAPPIEAGRWGNTKLTAVGLVRFYAAVKKDPVVGPWLFNAMSHMATTAADGTDQAFGLAAQVSAAPGTAAFKQGWGGDDDAFNSEQLNSTGLLDNRYAVAVFVQHIPYEPMSELLPVLNRVAAAVAPAGRVAGLFPAPAPSTTAPKAPATSAPATTAPPTSTASAVAPPTQSSPSPSASAAARRAGASGISALSGDHGLRRPISAALLSVIFGAAVVLSLALLAVRRRRGRHRLRRS
jgi:hypothetical protein